MPQVSLFVVPVDFSDAMESTVAAAFALAKQCESERRVDLLEITPHRRPSLLNDIADLQLVNPESSTNDWSRLEKSIQSAKRNGIRVRAIAYQGDATKMIASHAQLAKARLIVINRAYGTPRWRRSTRVTDDLIRSAPAPVLVWPAGHGSAEGRPAPFRHIVSAVDLTIASAVALRTVLDLMRRTGARLTLVHALKNAPQPMAFSGGEASRTNRSLQVQTTGIAERLRRKLPANADIRVDTRVTTGDPGRAILAAASEVNADLVVMGVSPRSRVDEVVFGSTLRAVLRRTKIPLLVVPVPAGAHKWLDETDGIELAVAGRTRRRQR